MSRFIGAEYLVPVPFWGVEWAEATYGIVEAHSTFIVCRITKYTESTTTKSKGGRKKTFPEYWFYQEVHDGGVLQAENFRLTSGLSFFSFCPLLILCLC
jgi:hypothetical protein